MESEQLAKTKTAKTSNPAATATSANVGYEAQLWQMADALRGSMDSGEYKHVCRRGRDAGCRDRRQPEGAWVWRMS